jgi:hypothetical protein
MMGTNDRTSRRREVSNARQTEAAFLPPTHPTAASLRRGESAAWGEKPRSALVKPKLRIISGKPIVKGALRFVGTVGLPIGDGELKITGVMAFSSHRKSWANLPSTPVLDRNGAHKTDETGKKVYAPLVEWSSKELRARFSAAVVDLVKQQFPNAFDDESPP